LEEDPVASATQATERSPGNAPAKAAVPPLRLELGGKEPEQVVPELIEHAARLHFSDLFFISNEDNVEVAGRHLGLLRSVGALGADVGRRCISYVKTAADMNISERRRPMDGRWLFSRASGHRLDLRINTIPTLHGEDCTLRILDQQHRLLAIDQLGLDPLMHSELVRLLASPSGLILVTGPTETGKSTTLYACLSHLNNGERKINTIEDPIEYSIRGIRQSQINTKIGLTFDELLRGVLRQAPDVIMIGEIRDAETALTAVRASLSGHLVLSTLHAPVASAAIHSMLRLDVHSHLLAASLLGVVSQRLLRTLCPHCKQGFELPASHLFDDVRDRLEPGEGEALYGPVGCPECHHTGYAARTGVFEMLRVGGGIRELIDERATTNAVRRKAVEEGLIEFRQSALLKIARGETSIEEVVRVLPTEYLEPSQRPEA
jgi:type II secretory ATPase GspE/PulE/Tfp pilus assembly ATPase PilB-like protein